MRLRLNQTPPSKKLLSALLLCVILSACTADSAKEEWTQIKESAQKAEQNGNKDEAERLYVAAVQKAEKVVDPEPLATSLISLSEWYAHNGQSEKCRDLLVRALEISRKQLAESKNNDETWRFRTAQTSLDLANVYREQGNFPDAETYYLLAATLYSNAPNSIAEKIAVEYQKMKEAREKSDRRLDNLVTSGEADFKFDKTEKKAKYEKLWKECQMIETGARTPDVEKRLLELLEATKTIFDPRDSRYREAITKLVIYYNRIGDYSKSERLIETDVKPFLAAENLTRAEAVAEPEKDQDAKVLSTDLYLLAEIKAAQFQTIESAKLMRRAIALRERWGPYDWELISMHRIMCQNFMTLRKPEAAMQELDRAFEVLDQFEERSAIKFHVLRGDMLVLKAQLEASQGSFEEAARHLAQARAIFVRNASDSRELITSILMETSDLARLKGDKMAEKAAIDDLLKYSQNHKDKDGYQHYLALQKSGHIEYTNHRFENALKRFQAAQKHILAHPNMSNLKTCRIDNLEWQGYTELRLNHLPDAERHFTEALNLLRDGLQKTVQREASLLSNIAGCKVQGGKNAEAKALYEKVLSLTEPDKEQAYEVRFFTSLHLADLETYQGNTATARDIEAKAFDTIRQRKTRADLAVMSLARQCATALNDGDIKAAKSFSAKAKKTFTEAALRDKMLLYTVYINGAEIGWLTGHEASIKPNLEQARLALAQSYTPVEYVLWDWSFDQSVLFDLPAKLTLPMQPSAVVEIARSRRLAAMKANTKGLYPVMSIYYGSVLLNWSGHSKEAGMLESLARELRDAELRRKPLRIDD
jgi:hypothetical protein